MGWVGFLEAVWQRLIYTQLGLLALGCMMTVIGAAYTFLTHDYHHEPRTLRGFLHFCVPPHILIGQQTRLDLLYATIKKAVRFLWVRAFVSNITFAYFFYAALAPLGRSGPAASLHHTPSSLERGVFLVVGIVVLDFFTFFAHVLLHKIPVMWKFHKVHHSALTLIPMTNLRFHPVQELWDALWNGAGVGAWIALFSYVTSAPLMDVTILNINALILISCFSFHQLRHSHIYMRYPAWLERIFMSPAQHQIHHSREDRHLDRNLGLLLSCWDQMLGTIVYSEPVPVTNLGLTTGQQNYMTVRSLFTSPFVELGSNVLAPVSWMGDAMESLLSRRVALAALAALTLWSILVLALIDGARLLAGIPL
jgi:sterol desaturase/sphingolipid hydroxylase (fatty acid hydroxylase superfamily)